MRAHFAAALAAALVLVVSAGVAHARPGKPSVAPPKGATEQINFEYAARAFGICARVARCKSGELWLEKATALEARWVVPGTVALEKLERHYRDLFEKQGYTVIGAEVDEITGARGLAAMKKEKGSSNRVRGVELIFRKTRAPANSPSFDAIEYFEGVGTPLGPSA